VDAAVDDNVLVFRSCWSYSSLTDICEGRRFGLGGAIKPGGTVDFFRMVGEDGERGLVGLEDMVYVMWVRGRCGCFTCAARG